MRNENRFRFFQTELKNDEKKVATLFIIEGVVTLLILANVIYLNVHLFQKFKPVQSNSAVVSTPSPTPTSCTTCLSPTPTISQQISSSVQPPQATDYFIPLGTGVNQTNTWASVPGVQATVDFGQYQNISSVVFEASIAVPTANQWVSVRLFNVTDQHPVWNSEMTMSGGPSAYLVSSPLIYDSGLKTYQVQMQTQLQYPAELVQSRIHIILQ